MVINERIKILRKEKGWSQGELAEKVGGDARQISRYENGHITPSADVLAKLAISFDVSVDYLLFEDAPRRPLKVEDENIIQRLQDLQHLSEEDKASILHILDALIARNKIKSFAEKLG
jgi:transcriptional regulator with XRE-family HTH domain